MKKFKIELDIRLDVIFCLNNFSTIIFSKLKHHQNMKKIMKKDIYECSPVLDHQAGQHNESA